MVGVSVVAAPVPTKDTHMKKPVPRGAARDLYRMICALSGACERDCGVLRDGALVDSLELQAKRILRARRAMSSSTSSSTHRLSTSPVLSAKAIPSVATTKLSKRRKLPAQDYDKADHLYGYDKSPMLSSKTFKSIEDVEGDKASIYMERADGSTSLIPSVKIGKIEPSKITPYVSGIAGDVVVNSVAISHSRSPSASPIHMEHLSLDKPVARSSRQSLDFGASMASTVSSYSMQHYDLSDTEDSAPSSLTPSARYASARTSYDYDYPPVRSCIRGSGSYGEERPVTPSSDLDDSLLSEFESVPSRRKDSCYSEASTTSLSGRATPKKLRFEMDALSLYEKESSIKQVESGLVETLQSQVDLLLSENVKALSENARLTEMSQMSACEAEAQTMEKLQAVEQVKKHSEQLEELEQKYLDTKQRADAQEDFRREAEVAFQLELDAKAKLVTSLQNQVAMKDEEIGRLSKRVEDISGLFASKMRAQEGGPLSLTRSSSAGHPASSTKHTAETTSDEPEVVASLRESNMFLDMELERMRASLLEKDREICNLYMHLSTKKNLIDEITKKFVQHMEEAAAAAKANNSSVELPGGGLSPDGVRFDLDMFLFKNVVDKQRRMEELTAALGVMDREVESLEARVAEKERENTQLRENQEFLTRSLQTVNAQVCRVQADNELLDASVQEQQARIAALMSSLEEKDREVLQLSEQSDLRQSLVSEDKSSGRRSLRNSLFKGRSSVSSPAAKASSRASTAGATSTPRKSDATTIRSSLDWTDAHRSSVVMQRESEFTKTKRSSVFSDVFKDISAPISDDDESLLGASVSDVRSTRASYCASEINEDEDLFSELFAKA